VQSADARVTVIVSVVAGAWAICTWIMTRALARARRDGVESAQLASLAKDMAELATAQQQANALIRQEIADDRKATDRRLRWLEEHLWKT
jgi:type VI protein secretion system component VasK